MAAQAGPNSRVVPPSSSSGSRQVSPARSPSNTGSQKGIVISEDVDVYQSDDFDSPVIGQIHRGQIYDISQFPKGAFFKIRIKPGVLGWVPDTEVRPFRGQKIQALRKDKKPSQKSQEKDKSDQAEEDKKNSQDLVRKPFVHRRYRGLTLESFQFVEDTMGTTRTESMLFYGVNWAGPNTMFDGDIYTDANIMLSLKPPKYYQEITGNSSQGWILKMNFAFETVSAQTKTVLFYYGFGPTFTYSHFDVTNTEATKKISYSLDDMNIGAVFHLGLGFKISQSSARLAFKYYLEKKSTMAGSLGLGLEF